MKVHTATSRDQWYINLVIPAPERRLLIERSQERPKCQYSRLSPASCSDHLLYIPGITTGDGLPFANFKWHHCYSSCYTRRVHWGTSAFPAKRSCNKDRPTCPSVKNHVARRQGLFLVDCTARHPRIASRRRNDPSHITIADRYWVDLGYKAAYLPSGLTLSFPLGEIYLKLAWVIARATRTPSPSHVMSTKVAP